MVKAALDRTLAGTAADRAGEKSLTVVAVIFFVSGFPALLYQLVWQRSLFLIFGINVESVTIVVTAFMLGLGLGSLAGGALSRLTFIPALLAFALIELCIAAFGAASLAIFDGVSETILHGGLLGNAMVAMAVLLVPTALMGASLPLLVRHFIGRRPDMGGAVGTLYYVNTLGAAVACFAAVIVLFPHLGMQGAVWLAALVNAMAGLAALGVYVKGGGTASAENPPAPSGALDSNAWRPQRLYLAAAITFFSGYMALSLEIYWFRIVFFGSQSQAPAFALTLGAVLLGIALGSRVARGLSQTLPSATLTRAVWASALAGTVLGFLSGGAAGILAPLGGGLWLAVMFLLIVATAGFWGAILPMVCQLGVPPDGRSGFRLGIVYAANIVGSAMGSVITGFILMDFLGLRGIAGFLLLTGLAGCLLIGLPASIAARLRRAAGIALAAVLGLAVSGAMFDGIHKHLLMKEASAGSGDLAHVIENRNGMVAVTAGGVVYGGGVYDGTISVDLIDDVNWVLRPFSVSLWHPAPKEVLIIGLSGGAWAQVVANNADVERVTIIEINLGYLDLVRRYPAVASLLDNPKVTVVIDDGRR